MSAPRPSYRIPFNRPCLAGAELEYMADATRRGHLAGDGHYTRRCSAILESMLGAPKVLLTTSCTHALEMSALLLDLTPDDEVILPSFTFVSTANAYLLRGARLRFVDVLPDTLNLDPKHLKELVTGRTRAIVPVHYAGVGCDMDEIMTIAGRVGAKVIEDNAHGLLGRYRDQPLGSFGALATQSFHETKNFQCGEAGALVVNDPELIARAEIIREKGTNRSRFFRGEVDKYTWVDLGSSYLPSELLAAFLLAQLEAAEAIQRKRQRIWARYHDELADWAGRREVAQPTLPPERDHPAHLYFLLLPNAADRDALMAHLRTRGIQSVFHYLPLHLSDVGRRLGGKPGDCPVTEAMSDRLLRLPLWNDLGEAEQTEVIAAIRDF